MLCTHALDRIDVVAGMRNHDVPAVTSEELGHERQPEAVRLVAGLGQQDAMPRPSGRPSAQKAAL